MTSTRRAVVQALTALLVAISPPLHADVLTDRARQLLEAGRAREAYELLLPEEAGRAGDPGFDYLLGIAALDAGQAERAVFALERVLAVQPGHHPARAEIARAYLALATSPTLADGSTAPGTFAGALGIDFATQQVTGNFNVAMPDGKGYAVNGTATVASSQFFMNGNVAGTGGACSGGCSAGVFGLFAGPAAERAGISYRLRELGLDPSKDILGAAAFRRNP